MERLSLVDDKPYDPTEAAIHLARYQIALPYLKGKKVLDIACGEGYGARFMLDNGALQIEGVDASSQAIESAQSLFKDGHIAFSTFDASRVDDLFEENTFDVVVSLETIEHLKEPAKFLNAIKKVAKEDAVIIITCPNDNWYYPKDEQKNPFHIRKYSFGEFCDLTASILGENVQWGYGVPMMGFGNVSLDWQNLFDRDPGQADMLNARQAKLGYLLPPEHDVELGTSNCSYFIGIWGADSVALESSAISPLSMGHYTELHSWHSKEQEIAELRTVIADQKECVVQFELDVKRQEDALDKFRKNEHQQAYELKLDREKYRLHAFALGRESEIAFEQVARLKGLHEDTRLQVVDLKEKLDVAVEQAEGVRLALEDKIAEREEHHQHALDVSLEQNKRLQDINDQQTERHFLLERELDALKHMSLSRQIARRLKGGVPSPLMPVLLRIAQVLKIR